MAMTLNKIKALAIPVLLGFSLCGIAIVPTLANDELRLLPMGYDMRFGVLAHGFDGDEKGTVDMSGEILFPKFDFGKGGIADYLTMRPQIGVDINTHGKSSFVYAGFAWTVKLPAKFVFELDFGGSVNNGGTAPPAEEKMQALGCRTLFHESAGIGYPLTDRVTVTAMIEHMSSANLCLPNGGMTNAGLKLGYSF